MSNSVTARTIALWAASVVISGCTTWQAVSPRDVETGRVGLGDSPIKVTYPHRTVTIQSPRGPAQEVTGTDARGQELTLDLTHEAVVDHSFVADGAGGTLQVLMMQHVVLIDVERIELPYVSGSVRYRRAPPTSTRWVDLSDASKVEVRRGRSPTLPVLISLAAVALVVGIVLVLPVLFEDVELKLTPTFDDDI